MKFDMHVKNIKFNGQIFKIHTPKKRYMRSLKSFSPNQFGKKLCSREEVREGLHWLQKLVNQGLEFL